MSCRYWQEIFVADMSVSSAGGSLLEFSCVSFPLFLFLLRVALFKFFVRIPVLFQGETADSVSYHLKETEYAFIPGRVCHPSSTQVIINLPYLFQLFLRSLFSHSIHYDE